MDDRECNETYRFLVDILAQSGLDWVIEQVEEQIRLGKTLKKKVDTLRVSRKRFSEQPSLFSVEGHAERFEKGPKATFPVTEEYQAPERLALLIDAIEHAVVNTSEMEYHLINFWGEEVKGFQDIRFHSEELESEPVTIDRQTVSSRLEQGKRLKNLLDRLREQIEK